MLSRHTQATIANPDGRGAPDASLDERKWPCQAGVTGDRGRLRQEPGRLMLVRDGHRAVPFSKARQSALDLGNVGWKVVFADSHSIARRQSHLACCSLGAENGTAGAGNGR